MHKGLESALSIPQAMESSSSSSSSKRVKSSEEEGKQWRWWEELSPEVLALIFVRVGPTDFMMRTLPFVCRAWREAVDGPYCWAEVDVEEWGRRVNSTYASDVAVVKLVRRSAGSLRGLCAYKLGDSGFSYAVSSGKLLNSLKMPMSKVTDNTVQKHVGFLQSLTVLDISYCLSITHKSIELIGSNCKSLVEFKRNMPPPQPDITHPNNGSGSNVDESEAIAVADTMHRLETLELAYGLFSDLGLDAILTKCLKLHNLDVRGCWNVKLEGGVDGKCGSIPGFKDPWYDQFDYEGDNDSGDDGENSDEDHGAGDGGGGQVVGGHGDAIDGGGGQAVGGHRDATDAGGGGAAAAAAGRHGDVVVISDDDDGHEDDWEVDSDDSWWGWMTLV